jgi:hypothetical protein
LVDRCSAFWVSRFPRTSLRVRGFADAGGVVGFDRKHAVSGTFGCSAGDVCFIRSPKFAAGAEFDEAEADAARFASIAASWREHVLRLLVKQCQRACH